MTKYSVDLYRNGDWESIALFANTCTLDAMTQFCIHQFELGNSLETPAENIAIIDMDTGEVMWDWIGDSHDDLDDFDYGDWDVAAPDDDCGFNPYEGCYDYDC